MTEGSRDNHFNKVKELKRKGRLLISQYKLRNFKDPNEIPLIIERLNGLKKIVVTSNSLAGKKSQLKSMAYLEQLINEVEQYASIKNEYDGIIQKLAIRK